MRIIDRGGGTPIVVIPGIQGRWEWMRPTIDALARRCHVITFSLADEPSCGGRFDEQRGIDNYVDQVRDALDQAGVERAAICGVSYGGLIAAACASRLPDRVASLILVSPIPPSWTPDARVRFYLRAPRLLAPVFCILSLRLYREIAAATPGLLAGVRAAVHHWWRAATHLFSSTRMARRVRMLAGLGLEAELARVRVPTLVVTGESGLDRVVPVARSREYVRVWPHAQMATIPRTGHLGSIMRPEEFVRLVLPFAQAAQDATARRRVG